MNLPLCAAKLRRGHRLRGLAEKGVPERSGAGCDGGSPIGLVLGVGDRAARDCDESTVQPGRRGQLPHARPHAREVEQGLPTVVVEVESAVQLARPQGGAIGVGVEDRVDTGPDLSASARFNADRSQCV